MKKLILISMLAIGMSVFAEKFIPSNKTLEISLSREQFNMRLLFFNLFTSLAWFHILCYTNIIYCIVNYWILNE